MKTNWMKLLGLALGIAVAAPLWAQDAAPTVDDIVKKTNAVSYYQGADGRARVKMTIKDKQGSTREREFTILRKNADDKNEAQKFFVYFHRPADVRQMVFMVWKHVGKDDDRWLYQPALDVVRQIAASDERTSFVGSTFFYEDVSGRGLDEDTHELVETTADYYVLKNTPKNPSAVEFDAYTMYIHKGTFIPVKGEYTDAAGNKIREMQALEVKEIQGFQTVTKSMLSDLRTGSSTTITYNKVEYNLGLAEDLFTERYLRNPPRAQLR